jgi:hypothetical protein
MAPPKVAQVRCEARQVIEPDKGASHLLVERLRFLCGHQAPPPQEHAEAEIPFELRKHLADRGLGHGQPFCRRRHGAGLHHRAEHLALAQVHHNLKE